MRFVPRSTPSPGASSSSTRPSSSPRSSSTRWACRPSKKTKTGYSTDASVLANLAPIHPIAEKIVEYRELTKLKSTYLDALPRMLGDDGRLHTSFNQTVAATGRLSSSNPNLQNIPVRTEYGRRIRAAFVPAEPGDVMVSADYSQIELRILAHLSGDEGLIEAFTSGMDFHQATAARVFGVEPSQVEPGMRARAKAVNFGIVYGQSAHGLADTLKIAHVEAQTMIDRYYAAYPRVRAYLDETVAEAHRDGFAMTLFGRKRRIPELASSNFNLRAFGERTAMNHPMQGTAADVMKLAMIEVDRRLRAEGFRARMLLQVHDELVFESPADEVERLSAMAAEAMSGVAAAGGAARRVDRERGELGRREVAVWYRSGEPSHVAVYVSAVPELEHQHEQHVIFDAVDDSVRADTNAAKLLGLDEPLGSRWSGFIGEGGDVWLEPLAHLGVKLTECPIG